MYMYMYIYEINKYICVCVELYIYTILTCLYTHEMCCTKSSLSSSAASSFSRSIQSFAGEP